jgi:hypothetical protein
MNRPIDESTLRELRRHLTRIQAPDASIAADPDFQPDSGTLIKLEVGASYWHLLHEELRSLLQQVPDGAGGEAIKRAVETHGMHVWHGPEPRQSRSSAPNDTSGR